MSIYRIVVTIPSEIFVDVESLADAQTFIDWVASQYDKVEYPISQNRDDRTGVASVKCLSIEPASEDDKITMMNSTMDAMTARKGLGISPESSTEPPEGPNAA